MLGNFTINRDEDAIHIISDIGKCYPEFDKQSDTITINAKDFPKNMKYSIVAKTSFTIKDINFHNVQFEGYAKMDGSITLSLSHDYTKINCTLYPVFKDDEKFDIRVW